MLINYRVCDRCGKKEEKRYVEVKEDENYPMYSMEVTFGMGKIRYNGKMIPSARLDLCDECLGFFLEQLDFLQIKKG